MRSTRHHGAIALLGGIALAMIASGAAAQGAVVQGVVVQGVVVQGAAGMVKTLKGQASVDRAGQTLPLRVGDAVIEGDQVRTGADSSIGITLRDDTQLAAGAKSTLLIRRFAFNPTTHAGQLDSTVKRGTLAVISGKIAHANPEAVHFSTSTMTLGVRGTEFIIDAGEEP